ncbi:Uncharacterised protein [uncultured archaeon]|nr:Uncharacterised protein [uncultured archaeon]
MPDEDDRNKGAVMAAIRCGESETIYTANSAHNGTLTAIKTRIETHQPKVTLIFTTTDINIQYL